METYGVFHAMSNRLQILILKSDTLETVHKIEEASGSKEDKFQVDDVKYSPDGLFLAAGTHRNVINIYQVNKDYKKIGTCKVKLDKNRLS